MGALWPALAISAVGLLCAAAIASLAPGRDYVLLPVAAGLAAFITTFTLWWLFVSRPARPSTWRGVVVGGLSGLLAHPVCWYLLICLNYVLASLAITPESVGGPPLDPAEGLGGALILSLYSLFLFGWITVPAGALTGGIVGWWQARGREAAPESGPPDGEGT